MNKLYQILMIIGLACTTMNAHAQRVFIDESVSKFDAIVFEEKDPNATVNWEIYRTENLNPTIAGNWNQMSTIDSAVFVFKSVKDRQAATFTYRVIEDSTASSFAFSGRGSDVLYPISYMLVDDIRDANIVTCLTPNKWIADNVIYKSNKEFNVNPAHWRFVEQEGEETIKVFITTNRKLANRLIYFTDNPLEAQIR